MNTRLTGQFTKDKTKTAKYASIEFVWNGSVDEPHFTAPIDIVEQLDKQFGSTSWDGFELLVAYNNDRWYYTGDYGLSDCILQFDRKAP